MSGGLSAKTTPTKTAPTPSSLASPAPGKELPAKVKKLPAKAKDHSRPTQSPAKAKVLPRPAVHLTWEVFGDNASQSYLEKTTTIDEYRSACRFFHGRLAFVVRGLSVDELNAIFLACLPPFLKEGDDYKRTTALEAFESAYDEIDRELTNRFRAHAQRWLGSPGGAFYRDKYLESR